MKKALVILALISVTFVLAQKSNGKSIVGNGKMVDIKRNTAEYEKIELNGSFDIDLVIGKEGNLIIHADENLVDIIETTVVKNTLSLDFKKGSYKNIQTKGKIVITIPVESINKITLSGSGDIVAKDNINLDNLELKLKGSGDINFKGKVNDLIVNLSGSGEIDCKNYVAQNTIVNLTGSGDIKVNCSEKLVAKLNGSGDIKYKGKPKFIDQKVNGSGDISSF